MFDKQEEHSTLTLVVVVVVVAPPLVVVSVGSAGLVVPVREDDAVSVDVNLSGALVVAVLDKESLEVLMKLDEPLSLKEDSPELVVKVEVVAVDAVNESL